MQESIVVSTNEREELIDITEQVKASVAKSNIKSGLCNVFLEHTSAALTINENDDPKIKEDIITFFRQTVKRGDWEHDKSGRCDRANADAHIKSMITCNNQTIPISDGSLNLGTWQNIFLCEFDGPRERKIIITLLGE